MKLKTLLLSVFSLLFLFLGHSAHAQSVDSSMSNDSYIIRMGNFNTAAGRSTGSANLNITVGQISPGLYTGVNYKLRAGFQYLITSVPFAFSISSNFINFGTLEPTNPVTRTNILTVSNRSSGGYIVTASEDTEMKDADTGSAIPDTTCDNGTCSEKAAGKWSGTLTYGFGYRCDGIGTNYCAAGFSNSAYFKQFSNKGNKEIAETVMKGTSGKAHKTQITYKVNVSAAQAAGFYTNTITYVATPTY